MFTFNFKSSTAPSKFPVSENGGPKVYPVVRQTRVTISEINSVDGSLIILHTASVVCHPKEKDITALGQKYAISALTQKIEDKEERTAIWKAFSFHSRRASRIMGVCME